MELRQAIPVMCLLSSFISSYEVYLCDYPTPTLRHIDPLSPHPQCLMNTYSFLIKPQLNLWWQPQWWGQWQGPEEAWKAQYYPGAVGHDPLPKPLSSFSPVLQFLHLASIDFIFFLCLYHPHSSDKSIRLFPWRFNCSIPKTLSTAWPSSGAPRMNFAFPFHCPGLGFCLDSWWVIPIAFSFIGRGHPQTDFCLSEFLLHGLMGSSPSLLLCCLAFRLVEAGVASKACFLCNCLWKRT